MVVTLEEMKAYLRVDFDEDDKLISGLILSAEKLCMDVARITDVNSLTDVSENVKTAVMYAAAYLYEHREEADHHGLVMTLRSLLFGIREEMF